MLMKKLIKRESPTRRMAAGMVSLGKDRIPTTMNHPINNRPSMLINVDIHVP